MPAARPDEPTEWLPSGFPPRSFPPGGAVTHATAPAAGRPPLLGRGRWLALAAALVAALLVIGVLAVSRDDDGASELASGTGSTTSAVDTSVPGFEETTSAPAPAPAPSIEPVGTTAVGAVTTPTAPVATGAPSGALEPSVTTLMLPKTDVTAGASRATFSLRNSGDGALSFTATSSAPGLSVAPSRGDIAPRASVVLTVTLDGARISGEGPFAGTLSFGGSGGAKLVQVQSVLGKPPEFTDDVGEVCVPGSASCSQQIKLAPTTTPDPSPCNTAWLYSITITDQSRIRSAQAMARVGLANADAPLRRGGSTDIFQSIAFPPLPPGAVLRFAMEAVDELGFGQRLPEQTIVCP